MCVALWQQLVPLIFLTLYLLSGRGTKSNVGPRLRPAASIQPLWDLRYRLKAGDYMYFLLHRCIQRMAKVLVRGCEKFVPALAYLFCLALSGSCLARFAYFLADLCIVLNLTSYAYPVDWTYPHRRPPPLRPTLRPRLEPGRNNWHDSTSFSIFSRQSTRRRVVHGAREESALKGAERERRGAHISAFPRLPVVGEC